MPSTFSARNLIAMFGNPSQRVVIDQMEILEDNDLRLLKRGAGWGLPPTVTLSWFV
jgi:hypothetical protein